MTKRLLLSFFSVIFIISLAALFILYGRGYRYDPRKNKVNPTGILSVSSYPQKASIYINGKLTSATDANITLAPDWYQVKISKEGYQSWEKRIRLQGEVVSQIDALLIPNNPSLKALTSSGIISPALSPSLSKVAYFITNRESLPVSNRTKNGLWVMELSQGPLGNKPEPKQVFIAETEYDFDNAKIYWSEDEKQLVLAFLDADPLNQTPYLAYLISLDNAPDESPINITFRFNEILETIRNDLTTQAIQELKPLRPLLNQFLSLNTSQISFSPDDSKILYMATGSSTLAPVIDPPLIGANPTEEIRKIVPGNYYIYDRKEDKNYLLFKSDPESKTSALPVWYSDSKHLLVVENEKIFIHDYDGLNKRSVYSGPFSRDFLAAWPTGGKILILTNFNQTGPLADLYEVDLR